MSGLVARDAHHLAREGLFRMTPAADREAAILRALEDAARQGIGMVHELGAPHICPPEDFDILGGLAEAVRPASGRRCPRRSVLGLPRRRRRPPPGLRRGRR